MRHTTIALLFSTAFSAWGFAQTPATYAPFGEGCNGTAVSNCLTLNDQGQTFRLASLPNEYAYPVVNTTGSPIQIVGFEVYTTTNTGNTETVKTGILWDATGAGALAHTVPDPSTTANGTITVDPVEGWYSTSVYPPVVVQPGVAFWFMVEAYSMVAPPQSSAGAAGPTDNYYRRPNLSSYAWTRSGSVTKQMFRIHCVAENPSVPSLLVTGLPQLGQPMSFDLSGGPANGLAFLAFALDDTQWLGLPTPVDLALAGAPGCFVLTSSDELFSVPLDPQGQVSLNVVVPNIPAFDGVPFYNQAFVIAPLANPLNVIVSNAGAGVLGV
ncbi:MAG: hypothetical protein H6834_05260 [Planctomycetes bacterium]|nr:hypothetical protein [Planctomycetota bacterium]